MKKTLRIIALLLAAVFFIVAAIIVIDFAKYALVVGDYEKTSHDELSFIRSGKAEYRIGRNSLGYPVFRSPKKALAAFTEEYADMIAEYASILKLPPLSHSSIHWYSTLYSGLSSKQAAELGEVAHFASTYKTSFAGTSVNRHVAAVGFTVFGIVLLVFALPVRKKPKPAAKASEEPGPQPEPVNQSFKTEP